MELETYKKLDYKETLSYLFSQLPMYQRVGPVAFKKDLSNTLRLCEKLSEPQKKFKSVHIAGTNGKGSVAHMLAGILQTAGYKTGLYTSPHLKDFRERIKINGKEISEDEVVEFVEQNSVHFESIKPSFFEMTVVMAFNHFAKHKVDIAIVETGLGGRFDSTNILEPILSVITNIGLDHTKMLGDTLEQIAFEKAGIIKQEVPVVVGESSQDTKKVFEEKAKNMNSELIYAGISYVVKSIKENTTGILLDLEKGHEQYKELTIGLRGRYQIKNSLTVLQAIEVLQNLDFEIERADVYDGLLNFPILTGLQGRWQIIQESPMVICDCAHNAEALTVVFEQVSNLKFDSLRIVLGTVDDKDIKPLISVLPKEARYYWCEANIPRALNKEFLQKSAKEYSLDGDVYSSVNEAFMQAKNDADTHDLVLITGSSFIVAEVLTLM